jgi:phage baseplate assembly protein W
MSREFLGTGWGFPIRTTRGGEIARVSGVEDIEQSIRIVLGTAKGERVMRPEFGCGIHEYTFATADTTTLTLVEDSVRSALVRWEPRIEVRTVEASTERLTEGHLLIRIDYSVKSTNTEHNLVYPFYVGGRQ